MDQLEPSRCFMPRHKKVASLSIQRNSTQVVEVTTRLASSDTADVLKSDSGMPVPTPGDWRSNHSNGGRGMSTQARHRLIRCRGQRTTRAAATAPATLHKRSVADGKREWLYTCNHSPKSDTPNAISPAAST